MIVTMHKVYVVARKADRDRLLEALRDLSVVHLAPVDPARAVADAETVSAVGRLGRAIQILESTPAEGDPVDLAPDAAAAEAMRIQRESVERTNRLNALYRQMEQLALWGDVHLDQFAALAKAGIGIRFFAVPQKEAGAVQAECVVTVGPWPGKRVLLAVIQRDGEPQVPETAEPVPLPARDRPALRAEAAEIDKALKADAARLRRIAHLVAAMKQAQATLREKVAWTVAARSALDCEALYALQGWVPEGQVAGLGADLAGAGIDAAVQAAAPEPDEEPPTLVRYPWWARPMKGLFDILGTVPGYREFDVGAAFMIALPIFSAILISDAGYGLMYVLAPALLYRRMKAAGAGPLAQLVIVVGVLSLIWGVLTTSFFGYSFAWMFGRETPFVAVDMDKQHLDFLMWLSITLGAVQLSAAHVWRAVRHFPHPKFLGEVGWAVFLWGMYGTLNLLLLGTPLHPAYLVLLIVGSVLAIFFADPSWNLLKAFALGLAKYPLSVIGTFGDTVSYVRLMAIGLGGSALAVTFNEMAASLPIYGTIPVLVLGHALNIALSIVALLAHGVRLNMLEFSNNLGMQWSGYPYEPFSAKRSEEN